MVRTREYIDQTAEDALLNYKYHGADHSFLSNVFDPFWCSVCEILPKWIAPNLLTFISFSCVIVVFVTLIFTHPHFDIDTQTSYYPIMYIVFAILIWVYQTLDAVDGKQARRTNSSSPLGELFDHGCDALTSTFQTALACCMLGLGNSSAGFFFFLGSNSTFHLCIFEEYTTLCLRFGVFNAVTEILTAYEIILIFTAIFRGFPWRTEIPFMSSLVGETFTLGWCVALFSCFLVPFNIYDSMKYTIAELKANTEQVQERGLTFIGCLMGLIPGSTIIIVFTTWWLMDDALYRNYVFLFCCTFSLCMSYLSCRMIIHRVCKQSMKPFYWILVPVIVGFVINNFIISAENLQLRFYVFVGMLIVILYIWVHFVYYTINEITAVLGIYLFSLKKIKDV